MSAPTAVLGVGTLLPGPALHNDDLVECMGLPRVWAEWMELRVGSQKRHLAVDQSTADSTTVLTDMLAAAAECAIAKADVAYHEIDALVVATATPDEVMPTTANRLAGRLGLTQVSTYQITSGCTGTIQAIALALALIDSQRARRIVVAGGDVSHRMFDRTRLAGAPTNVTISALLFGDGAGAIVLGTAPAKEPGLRLLHAFHQLSGTSRRPGLIISELVERSGATAIGLGFREDLKAIEQIVPRLAYAALTEVLDAVQWSSRDVTHVLVPQLSVSMSDKIVRGLGLPRATPVNCVENTGNAGNALPFLLIQQLRPMMGEGDKAVGMSVEASSWIQAGYALELR